MRIRNAYPIVISKEKDGYYVDIPDFQIGTQGDDIADCMMMARDAIGLMGIDLIDEGKKLPEPNSVEIKIKKSDIVTYVDVDFIQYRNEMDMRSVKKNCTIPYWLNKRAEQMNINFSGVLQEALLERISKR